MRIQCIFFDKRIKSFAHPFLGQMVQPMSIADFVISVDIEDRSYLVYVAKRPGVDQFLERLSTIFEIVVFTASVSKVSLARSVVVGHRASDGACLRSMQHLYWIC